MSSYDKVFDRRKTLSDGWGWMGIPVGWDFICPLFGGGVTATIFAVSEGFLAVSFGSHIKQGCRAWRPVHRLCETLESAMDFCEDDMERNGIIKFGARAA